MTLTCHVTKERSNIMGGSPPMASPQLAKFGSHRQCGSRELIILGYHVISQ